MTILMATVVTGASTGQVWLISKIKSMKKRWRFKSSCICHHKLCLVISTHRTSVMMTAPPLRIEFSLHLYPLALMITHLIERGALHINLAEMQGVIRIRFMYKENFSKYRVHKNEMRKGRPAKSWSQMSQSIRRLTGLIIINRVMIISCQLNSGQPSATGGRSKIRTFTSTPP